MAWTLFDTTLGTCGLAWSDAGVTWLQLPEADDELTRERLLAKAHEPGARARANPPWVKDAIARIREHLAGKPQDLTRVPLDLSRTTPFHATVYRALQRTPAGATTTYGDLARAAGSTTPGAARAVGRAMATNPFPLLVPCHRVLAAEGKPGGFSAYGGRVTKEKLLAAEGALLQTSLFEGRHALPFDWSAAVEHVAGADTVLARHIERVGPSRKLMLEATAGTFETLVQSIVYQQLNGKAAATILGRVRQLYPGGVLEPERVLATADGKLRAAGLSRGKLASLRDLATRARAGEIPTLAELERMDDEAIVERLTKVRGIGRWTVEMLLIFRLGRPDVLPVADYGIRKGFAQLFARGKAKAELPAPALLVKRGERWRPFRSVASWYLWRALEKE